MGDLNYQKYKRLHPARRVGELDQAALEAEVLAQHEREARRHRLMARTEPFRYIEAVRRGEASDKWLIEAEAAISRIRAREHKEDS
jgi:hypothetical protein